MRTVPSLPAAEVVSIRERLLTCLYETYTKTRIEQLFEIIIEFPESQPALEDLRDCLAQTEGLRTLLTSSLRQVLDAKLLHPGVNTADILTAYIAAIRALRVLDNSGVVLELVCSNVRRYLKTREDTVRCIVQSLIDEATELTEELTKGAGLQLEHSFQEDAEVLEDLFSVIFLLHFFLARSLKTGRTGSQTLWMLLQEAVIMAGGLLTSSPCQFSIP